MTLHELTSSRAVQDFIRQHPNVVMTFSAHWCGPCKASKPALQQMAQQCASDATMNINFGICYESDLDPDDLHSTYQIRAFPTYVLFQQGVATGPRVEGANLSAVRQMIDAANCQTSGMIGRGETLGGGTSSGSAAMTLEQARLARLAKLGGGNSGGGGDAVSSNSKDEASQLGAAVDASIPMQVDDEKEAGAQGHSKDVSMENEETRTAATGDEDESETATPPIDPTANLDPIALQTLMNEMGFIEIRAQKGLLYGNGGTVEGAVEWLMQHQDDDDIDDPIPASAEKAQSYRCNECGRILSNMANLELHANKTGHSDFEESTKPVKPLTEDEKQAKLAEIKALLKAKRAEREEAEKVDDTEREKQRRMMGKEMSKTKEMLEMEQRKREVALRRKEKEDFKRERARIKAELAKDRAERQVNKGKLSSKLSVAGYNPDGIQYDVDLPAGPTSPAAMESAAADGDKTEEQHKKPKVNPGKIDDFIAKVSSYRAGGDGGKCLKVLLAYVGNLVDHPGDEKYQRINMDNKAFKTKVKPFFGAKNLLMAIGFAANDAGDALELANDQVDRTLLADTKAKLEAALQAYG